MRRVLVISILATFMGACAATNVELVPTGPGTPGQTVAAGIRLRADPDAWTGSPSKLPEHVTPIAVVITNHTDRNLRISYADFSLFDDRGIRYAVVDPYAAAPMIGSRPSAPVSSAAPVDQNGTQFLLVAENYHIGQTGPSPVGGEFPRPIPSETGTKLHPSPLAGPSMFFAYRQAPPRYKPVAPQGFFVAPRDQAFFTSYQVWPHELVHQPGYDLLVRSWSAANYEAQPPRNVLRRGLPEGVLAPGGQVSGFLYFQRATLKANTLRFVWNVRTPSGVEIQAMQVPFAVKGRAPAPSPY